MKKAILIALVFMLAASSVLWSGGIALSGVGGRGLSMGGAMRGLADDFTCMYWNPAGLGFYNQNTIATNVEFLFPSGEYTPAIANWPGMKTDDKIDAEKKTWFFPNLFAVKKATSKLNYGVGIYVPYGLGAEWNLITPVDSMVVNSTGTKMPVKWTSDFPETEMMSSIGIVDFHPALSYNIFDNFSVGAGLSVLYGMIEIKKMIPHAAYYTYLPTIMDIEGTGLGFGGNWGTLYKMNESVQIGLSGKLPANITLKGDATKTSYINSFIGYNMTHTTFNPADYFANIGSYATKLETKSDVEAELKLPADIALGFAYHIKPNWVISQDITWTGWKRLDKIEIEYTYKTATGDSVFKSDLNTKWKDTFRYSLGTEYIFANQMAFRTGIFYDQSPIPDESLDPTWPDVGDKTSFNIGFGMPIMSCMQLDLAYEDILFAKRTIKEANTNVVGAAAMYENMIGKYSTNVKALNIALSYKF